MTKQYVISLCDYSGNWARPWAQAGYTVILVDPKHPMKGDYQLYGSEEAPNLYKFAGTVGDFINSEWPRNLAGLVHLVIAQPPCTQFAGSGARWWQEKSEKSPHLLSDALSVVRDCLEVVRITDPTFWVLENPVGRLGRLLLGEPDMTYQPHEYAGWLASEGDQDEEAYTKRTCLWGNFNTRCLQASKKDVGNRHGSKMWAKYGSKSDLTKERRSMTPRGFAEAFFWCHA